MSADGRGVLQGIVYTGTGTIWRFSATPAITALT
jgi:hypothetical protein